MRVPVYKKLTYPQLRSFYESARLGNITAAAESLDVAQPTVWKQVRALENHLGTPLLISNGRGCSVTAEGEILLRLLSPFVGGIENLVELFHTEIRKAERKLVVAVSPRPADEELPLCIPRLQERLPHIHFVLFQVTDIDVVETVVSGMADLGITTMIDDPASHPLAFEPVCTIEPVLLIPKRHPLATKRRIVLADLARYPLLNRSGAYPDKVVNAILEKASVFANPDRRLELSYANTIHCYVKLGYGIGIVGRVRGVKPDKDLVERPLGKLFGSTLQGAVAYRKRKVPDSAIDVFVDVLREVLGDPASHNRPERRTDSR